MNSRFEKLNIENFIWIIYIFIAIAAIVSNYYEKKYYLFNEPKYRDNYKTINIINFTIAFFIYLYFLKLNYQNIKEVKRSMSNKNILERHASFIAACLFLIGGIIYLFVEISSSNSEEVAIL